MAVLFFPVKNTVCCLHPVEKTPLCKYLEIRPSPDRSPPDPSVEKHSDQGTLAEYTDTVPVFTDVITPAEAGQYYLDQYQHLKSHQIQDQYFYDDYCYVYSFYQYH